MGERAALRRGPLVPCIRHRDERATLSVMRASTRDPSAPPGRLFSRGELVRVEREGDFARVTMDVPERRNALSLEHMRQLLDAVRTVGESDARGMLLAAEGPVFCAGHDFRDMVDADLVAVRELLAVCTELMTTLQSIPQPVLARVHGLATAAGCQLVATADLAVASEDAGFAIPGGKGGWFCHTPLVAVARALPRKRALEMAFTGDVIDARTAEAWGLVNAVVPADELDAACLDLLGRATRGSRRSKGLGKQGFYAQVDLDQPKAYAYAVELMAATSQTPDAREGMAAFLETRAPRFD
jgi:enoyl-CoA hydratase/carnithine racemase